MHISLIFSVFNKEKIIGDLLHTWMGTLSGQHKIEVIMVFDAPKDNSHKVAQNALKDYPAVSTVHLSANDMYEIHCNQLGFQQSHGEWVIFAQDDCWMYDRDWDHTLVSVVERIHDVGVIGLLAGSRFYDSKDWKRLEIDRAHKGDAFDTAEPLQLGVWQCDAACRPFAISAKLLTEFKGLNLAYCPLEFDDVDVCVKALRIGRRNLLIPFDIKNTTASKSTISAQRRAQIWAHSFWRFGLYHACYLDQRGAVAPQLLYPLREAKGGLELV